jgi:hypothetical protein
LRCWRFYRILQEAAAIGASGSGRGHDAIASPLEWSLRVVAGDEQGMGTARNSGVLSGAGRQAPSRDSQQPGYWGVDSAAGSAEVSISSRSALAMGDNVILPNVPS